MTTHHPQKFSILGAQVVTPNWTGAPTTLNWHDSVSMPQTPTGSTVLAWQNTATGNNDGQLSVTTGASDPQFLDAPALATMPSVQVQNWNGNNLNITNISGNNATPIWVEMFGPGIPGAPAPATLAPGAAPVSLAPGGTAAGKSPPNWAQLVMQANSGNLTIIALVGGPMNASKTNAQVFALNCSSGNVLPGYTKVTATNSITFQFQWTSGFFIANMSPSNAAAAQVSLISL